MDKIKPIEVYVPVDANERKPKDNKDAHFVLYDSVGIKGVLHKDYFKRWEVETWLEPLTRYVLSKEEMIELLENAFDAGFDFGTDDEESALKRKFEHPDKTTFINSIIGE
jgi:hypothetical protein